MIVYVENPNELIKKLLELIKVAGYKVICDSKVILNLMPSYRSHSILLYILHSMYNSLQLYIYVIID